MAGGKSRSKLYPDIFYKDGSFYVIDDIGTDRRENIPLPNKKISVGNARVRLGDDRTRALMEGGYQHTGNATRQRRGK